MARSASFAILILVIALLVVNLAMGEEDGDRGEDKASDALRSNGCLVNLYKW